jgi:putative cell wall-binding protein
MICETAGDGTVPYLSGSITLQVEQLEQRRWRRFPTDHTGAPGHHNEKIPRVNAGADASVDWIIDILLDGDSDDANTPLASDTYIVARVACPVDVTVERGGETLSSPKLDLTASYGRMDIIGPEDDIKMFCVDEADDYAVTLAGTDTGTMDYTLRYFAGDGSLTDERRFTGVPVTADTVIYTSTEKEETVLHMDADGDGDIDHTWTAQANETVTAADLDPQDPDSQNPDPQNPDPQNPEQQNPDPQNPDQQNPEQQNPDPQTPDSQNPDPENPNTQNPDSQNPDPQNPDPQNPDSQNPDIQDPDTQDPEQQNPDPQKPTSPTRNGTFSNSSATLTYIGGADRVLTSVAISRYGWTTADTVILASGADANLVDALAAAPLAGQEDAPILLCMGDELDPAVQAELLRLQPKKICAVGAVSQTVVDKLTEMPEWSVETLRGRDRFETAALLNAKVQDPQGTFIVGYNAVADAVSAAPYAAAHNYLIQIAKPDGTLEIDYPVTDRLYILGGPALVRDIPGAERIAGADRYATNQALRDTLTFNSEHIYIADGLTLVDALTGSALAAQTGSAIVLSPGDDILNVAALDADSKVYVLGGGNE